MAWTTTAAASQRGLFQPVRARTADLPPLLRRYYAGLSRRPYAWHPEKERIYIRGKDYALDYPNLSHGLPTSAQWIVLDIDRPIEHLEFGYEDRPRPHVVAQNPDNGHAHLYFPLAWASKLDRPWLKKFINPSLIWAWEADPHFSGKIGKNLLRPDLWDIYTRNAPSWTFSGLAERLVDFPLPRRQLALWPEVSDQPGRNCEVFEAVRVKAYRARRCGADYDALLAACDAWCEEQNTYRVPLGYAECRHIAKSIARWTAAHLVPGHVWHAAQGRKSGDRRRQKSAAQIAQALELHRQGLGTPSIARTLGVSRGAVVWWLRQARHGGVIGKGDRELNQDQPRLGSK